VRKRSIPNVAEQSGGPSHIAAMETAVFEKLHELVKHCCVTRYEDGTPRKPGWFTIKTYGSAWVVQVKDPDSALSLAVTQQSLDDALALVDVLLGSEEAPWEPDPFLKPKPSPKVNKRAD